MPLARNKKVKSFLDQLKESNRNKQAKHKGGQVPIRRKKVEVEYYSDGEGKKVATQYELMVPQKTKIKAFSREEER